jgi:hypothetical protein
MSHTHYWQQASSMAIRAGESHMRKKEVNLKMMLLAFFAVLFHLNFVIIGNNMKQYEGAPINAYSSSIVLNLMLVSFILDRSVWKFVKHEISRKLQVFRIFCKTTQVTPELYEVKSRGRRRRPSVETKIDVELNVTL